MNRGGSVHDDHPDLVAALQSDDSRERKSAKSSLKRKYLDVFKQDAQPGTDDYKEFYKLTRRINAALNLEE